MLTTGLPLRYTPTASNITIQFTLKGSNAQQITVSKVYDSTVLGLAYVVSSTVAIHGNEVFPRFAQKNSTFATSYPRSNLQFMMTTSNYLPIYAVADVLMGLQELTHYLYFLEMVFEVFSDTSPTSLPIASGCLAFDCNSHIGTLQTRDLEYANLSTANFSTAPSRRLQSTVGPVLLTTSNDKYESVSVICQDLKDSLPIHSQSFADIATRMLANMTALIIANRGDGPFPRQSSGRRPMLRYVDTWGSNLALSLFPSEFSGADFTLGQAAKVLEITQNNLSNRPMVESRLKIELDGLTIGWGCLSYVNGSAWRCILPIGGTFSSVGSREQRLFPKVRTKLMTACRIQLGCSKRCPRS